MSAIFNFPETWKVVKNSMFANGWGEKLLYNMGVDMTFEGSEVGVHHGIIKQTVKNLSIVFHWWEENEGDPFCPIMVENEIGYGG